MFVFKHSHLSKFSCRLGPARLLRKVRVGTPFLVCRLMDALLLSSSLHFHSSNPRHDNVIRDARPLFFDFSILSISSLRLFSSSLKKRQTSNRQIVIVSTLVPTNFIISRFAVYAMSERRFSLAIEDVDTSESPESPINKPLSGFLVENHCPTLTKSSSFTSIPKMINTLQKDAFLYATSILSARMCPAVSQTNLRYQGLAILRIITDEIPWLSSS